MSPMISWTSICTGSTSKRPFGIRCLCQILRFFGRIDGVPQQRLAGKDALVLLRDAPAAAAGGDDGEDILFRH